MFMVRTRQILLLAACLAGVVGTLVACSTTNPADNGLTPISVVASTTGRFGTTYSWHLSVNADRKARLIIDTRPEARSREFEISPYQFNQLAKSLEEERFFALQSDYGQEVSDGSTSSITVVKGGVTHTVRIHFLMNWVHGAPWKLREPARAVRVFQVVRGWFDDKDAVDLRRYDDMVLKAVGTRD